MSEEIQTEIAPAVEQPEPQPTIVDNALTAADRLEKAIENMKTENDRADKRFALQQLGGTSQAGQPQPEKKELTPQEYAQKVLRNEI